MLKIFFKYQNMFIIILAVLFIKTVLFFWAGFNFHFAVNAGSNWINIWDRWDSNAFKTIATSSYNFVDIKLDYWAFLSHFLPLYPLVMAIVAKLMAISLTTVGVLVSTISIIIASVFLYNLVLLDFKSEKAAWFSVLFLNLYPISYFTIAVYSESLFLLFSISSFYFLRKEHFFRSGMAAGAAILTRFVGVVFLPVYALYFSVYCFQDRKNINLKTIYAILPFLLSYSP